MESASKRELVNCYSRLQKSGLNDSHSGNASVRCEHGMWITPTGACADDLDLNDLVLCPAGVAPTPGASLDAPLHAAIYLKLPEARAVLHFHPAHAIALTLDGQDFLPEDFEGSYFLSRVPVLDLRYDRYTQESPKAVSDALLENRITIVRGHGAYVCGNSLDQAYKWASALESSARITWLARVAGITCR
ncbi:MAG: class II aldolase/adducin family protein [Gammaproteobacteria bacterium]|jgi:L-fuculose-phosphate aldolase|nr:class II aldolase/adducin family protein [Gammaproteobacteria bacterium]